MAEQLPVRVPNLIEHESRRVLAGEVHARPYEPMTPPVRASHLAWLHAGHSAAEERAHLVKLLAPHGAEPPADGANHIGRNLGALRLRWERHSEFSTITFLRFDACDHPFRETALDLVPAEWLEAIPGQVVSALHLAVDREDRALEDIQLLFDGNSVAGSTVVGGGGRVWTDFRLHADGFGRILVRELDMNKGQVGRLVQRLAEIETYRMMALLGFPVARQAAAGMMRIDRELADIVAALAQPEGGADDRTLLDRLTALAAEAERLDADTAFRLTASRAYFAIVRQRIAELREERMAGIQTIAEFMDRRLTPAMSTCDSAAERGQLLSRRVSRAGALLRTRVDIALEEKNRDLLKSMNRRAKLQLHLQETVEGLSVVAISYYLLGLVGYIAKGAKAAGLHIDSDLAGLIGLPIVLGAVWLGLKRVRKALGNGVEH